MEDIVICVVNAINKCKNYKKECYRCKWNANNIYGDYLLIQNEDGKTLHFLDTTWI